MSMVACVSFFFFFNDTATTEIYTLSLHDALPICDDRRRLRRDPVEGQHRRGPLRSEEHTSELQSLRHLVCRLLLEKKKTHSTRDTRRKEKSEHNRNTRTNTQT